MVEAPYTVNGVEIPRAVRRSIDYYAQQRVQPGGFVRAVLENDLLAAVQRADSTSAAALPVIVDYVYFNLPAQCYGSPAKVAKWLAGE